MEKTFMDFSSDGITQPQTKKVNRIQKELDITPEFIDEEHSDDHDLQ